MNVPAETSTLFWGVFNDELAQTKERLASAALDAGDLESLRTQVLQLQVYATESTSILPPYDIRRSQELIDTIGKELHDAEVRLKPRKKFTFSSKNKAAASAAAELAAGAAAAAAAAAATTTTTTEASAQSASSSSSSSSSAGELMEGYTVKNLSSRQVVILTERELGRTHDGILPPLLLTNCSDIIVSARCLLGAVRLENCSRCQVFLGPCSTSVYLEDCSHCLVFLASHQLRIHKCVSCSLYVKVNSHPIIEDCSDMGFAPYLLSYQACALHMGEAALLEAKCWDNVVDFRWHRSTHSPNWFSISEAERCAALPTALCDSGWVLSSSSSSTAAKPPPAPACAKLEPTAGVFAVPVSTAATDGEEDEI